ncbi:MAG: hydrolase [Nitrosopumilus sp.]|nr:hydrolase [Nitrosopumilus sp.]
MYAIWLLFNKTDTKYLKKIIKEFSNEFDSPIFVPHITVYALLNLDIKLIKKIVKRSIQDIEPFIIEKSRIKESDEIWKTLFVEIKMNRELNAINNNLKFELIKSSKYKFSPHISLLYKKTKKKNRILSVKNLKIKTKFQIDKIGILKFSNNVNEWKIIKTIKF